MSTVTQVQTQVKVVRNAQILLAPYTGDTIGHAWRELGNTENLPIELQYNEISVPNYETGKGKWLHSKILTGIKFGPGNVFNNTPENAAIALNGTLSVVAQSASSATAYAIASAERGMIYSLGRTSSLIEGHHSVSNLVVDGTGGTPTYTVDTDYKLDAESGDLFITEDSTINGVGLECDYDYAAKSVRQIVPQDGIQYYQLKIRSINPVGPNETFLCPKVSPANEGAIDVITPEGAAASFPIGFLAEEHPDFEMFYHNGAPYTP